MIQLNPMLPFWHIASHQPCYAFMVIDYSQEHDLMLACILQNGEIWTCRAAELRGQENMTLGRPKSAVNAKPNWFESAQADDMSAWLDGAKKAWGEQVARALREASQTSCVGSANTAAGSQSEYSVSAMQNPSEGHYVE